MKLLLREDQHKLFKLIYETVVDIHRRSEDGVRDARNNVFRIGEIVGVDKDLLRIANEAKERI